MNRLNTLKQAKLSSVARVTMFAILTVFLASQTMLAGCGQNPSSSETDVSSAAAAQTDLLSADKVAMLDSLEKVDENFYVLDYTEDYALDHMLSLGAADTYELAEQVSEQALGGLPFQFSVPALGCSAFTAVTPQGDYIQGRNLDIADAQNTLVRTNPKDGYASLSVTDGLFLGYASQMPESAVGRQFLLAAPYYPIDGINEKGLSVALLLLYDTEPVSQDTGKTPITTTMAIRMMLDKAATVDEAVALLASYDMNTIANSNMHFQVADAQGNSAVIEYVNNQMQVLYSEEYGSVVTNFYLSRDVEEDFKDGEDRYHALHAALDENNEVITPEKAMELLESVIVVDDYDVLTGISYNTTYSIVFNNSKSSLDVCLNRDYSTAYHFTVAGESSTGS